MIPSCKGLAPSMRATKRLRIWNERGVGSHVQSCLGHGLTAPRGKVSTFMTTNPNILQLHGVWDIFSGRFRQTVAAASSRFQAIFLAALKSYRKQTKEDIVTYPLVSQL